MSSKLAIVIIPGSFSYASAFYDVIRRIEQRGYEAYVGNLPSVIREPPEKPATLSDDADHFRNIIAKLADQGKDVIVLTHSYGGTVGSEAVKGVSKVERQAKGLGGGVVRLVYLTAFVLPESISMDIQNGERPPGLIDVSKDGYMSLSATEIIAKATFSDIPFEKASDLVKLMPHHSALSFAAPLAYLGYKHVPCSYILCENDHLVVPEKQLEFIDRIRNASGRDVGVHRLSSGHAPNLSEPEKLVEIIVKIAAAS